MRSVRLGVWGLVVITLLCARGGAQTAPSSQAVTWPNLKEVIVVFKTHFDLGYTDLVDAVLDRYRTTMIDGALAVCDRTNELPAGQQFVWTLPAWPMARILGPDDRLFPQHARIAGDGWRQGLLWPAQDTPRRDRIVAAIRAGRFVWHALPFTMQTESLELEDVVRGLDSSSALSRAMSVPLPRDAKMTDVPSHVWSLPTILARAGVEFLHLGCNGASPAPDVPPLFWWEGPDGSRLLTFQSPQYGTALLPPADWPHPVWLALIHTGDNKGPPAPPDVQKLLDEAARRLPGVRIRMGRLSDFADAILRGNPSLPIVRADMPDTWIHGIMASPIETGAARRLRPMIAQAEALHTLLRAWGVEVPAIGDETALAREESLLYGEHTWGMNPSSFGPRLYGAAWQAARARGTYAKLERAWADHAGHVGHLQKLVDPLVGRAGRSLAEAVAVAGPRIVVFNPLPWRRDALVAVEAGPPFHAGLVDAKTGQAVPCEPDGTRVRFVARNLPPLGYRTYSPGLAAAASGTLAADAATGTLENDRLRLRLDLQRGAIASLVDKRTGRERVDALADFRLGQYLYERFDADQAWSFLLTYCGGTQGMPWWEQDFGKPGLPPASEVPYAASSPADWRLEFAVGPVSVSAVMSAPASERVPHPVTITVTLYRGLPFVDLAWSVTGKQADPWPEAGWLCLPFRIDSPRFGVGRLGCVVDPARDLARATNHHVLCVSTGLTVTNPNGDGVGLCPLDSPLVSLDRPGLWRFSRDFAPARPAVFVNLFNNQWSTNYPQWIEGTWSSRVRIWPVDHEGLADALIAPSWEARMDCVAAACDSPGGPLPAAQAGMDFSRRGLVVTALGANPDGPGTLLRLWEQVGSDEPCRIRFGRGLRPGRIQPVDLRGRAVGEPLAIEDGTCLVPLPRFAPTSLVLDPAD